MSSVAVGAIKKALGMENSQEKDYSFLGNDTFPNLYDALVWYLKYGGIITLKRL